MLTAIDITMILVVLAATGIGVLIFHQNRKAAAKVKDEPQKKLRGMQALIEG